MDTIGIVSFALAAVAHLALAVLLLTSWKGKAQGGLLIGVTVIQMLWAIGNLTALNADYPRFAAWIFLGEVLKTGAWFYFIGMVFHRVGAGIVPAALKWSTFVVPLAVIAAGLQLDYSGLYALQSQLDSPMLALLMMMYNLFGIVLVEQFYRNNNEDNRWRIKFLCFAVGGLFAYDFFYYGYSYLMSTVSTGLWLAKGTVSAAIVPFIAISAARNPGWSLDVFVSRRFAFYTSTVVAAGIYLLLMSLGGYFVRQLGGNWGAYLQGVFVTAALLVLFVVLFSGRARAWLKVFLSKHFYSYKYDYRDEWLRMMQVLQSSRGERLTPYEKAVKALAQIVESPSGALWYRMQDDGDGYRPLAAWHDPNAGQEAIAAESELVRFLTERQWIIDLGEYKAEPDKYNGLDLPAAVTRMPEPWLIIPLLADARLEGFVVLNRPRTPFKLTWEDRDLLKTVAQQSTIYLAQIEMAKKLAETQQFAAFNRLSAYVVHDLNNLVAQLQLVTRNAEKHKHNPAFMDDAIDTVRNAVAKMDRLLAQLKKGRFEQENPNVIELNRHIARAVTNLSKYRPMPVFEDCGEKVHAAINPDRFVSVIEHLVRNAQEATDGDSGRIAVRLERQDSQAVIEVTDNGCGMDRDFIENRLFKPFDTTKGNAGMGIGMYQSKQLVTNAGGRMEVTSTRDEGTRIRIMLPLTALH